MLTREVAFLCIASRNGRRGWWLWQLLRPLCEARQHHWALPHGWPLSVALP